MKTNFKFYFNIILATAFLTAFLYGTAERLVIENLTVFSFSLMGIVLLAMAGMMRSLAQVTRTKVGSITASSIQI